MIRDYEMEEGERAGKDGKQKEQLPVENQPVVNETLDRLTQWQKRNWNQ